MSVATTEEVLVLDFGGQYSQLIARRIRECGVFAELMPATTSVETILGRKPEGPGALRRPGLGLRSGRAVISARSCSISTFRFSASVTECRRWPRRSAARSKSAETGEFGRTDLFVVGDGGTLLGGLPREQTCWMSHRDSVFEAPEGFTAIAASPGSPVAALEDHEHGLYGIQFHPGSRPHPLRHRGPQPLPA